ncbi:MAG: DUF1269 domain-containing protein [Eubacteriales bacterium]|nr:DUF1269 domain-containing protein [Eubacteriales bacterium]
MENIVLAAFQEESLAYQAFSKIKNTPSSEKCAISQLALLQKQGGKLSAKEYYDSGIQTEDDTLTGGLVGALAGILGGPVGMLLGASMGMFIGAVMDLGDAGKEASYLEEAALKITDGTTALVALAIETDETALDEELKPLNASITRFEAAVMQEEVEEAIRMQDELATQVRREIRQEKTEARRARIAELKAKARSRV